MTYVQFSAPSGARIIIEVTGDSTLERGARLGLSFDPVNILAFDAENGARLR